MAPHKVVARYRIAYIPTGSKANQTEIIVYFEDGTYYHYEGLSPEAGHHLVDMLRNERPIWVDPQNGVFVVADEPVGSGEEP